MAWNMKLITLLFILPLIIIFTGCDNKPIAVNLSIQKQGTENRDRYVIYNDTRGSTTTPMILDKETGKSWRYFRNTDKDGNVTDEGWTSLMYDILGSKGVTPEIAEQNFEKVANSK